MEEKVTVAILYNSIGCEIDRIESTRIGDIMRQVNSWLMYIQSGDTIKFE